MQRVLVVIASVLLLVGCGGAGDVLGGGGGTTSSVDVVETLQVDYYYACGNEVLELPDGRRFYPLVEQDAVDEDRYDQDAVDEDRYDQDAQASVQGVVLAMRLAVVEPGPGDDTGTLTIYEDGMAHFVSDSGIEAWLTDEPIEYRWVC